MAYLRQEDEERCEGFRVVDDRFQQPPMFPVQNVEKTLNRYGRGSVNSENMRILQRLISFSYLIFISMKSLSNLYEISQSMFPLQDAPRVPL